MWAASCCHPSVAADIPLRFSNTGSLRRSPHDSARWGPKPGNASDQRAKAIPGNSPSLPYCVNEKGHPLDDLSSVVQTSDPQARHGLIQLGGGGLEACGAGHGTGGLLHLARLLAYPVQVAGDLPATELCSSLEVAIWVLISSTASLWLLSLSIRGLLGDELLAAGGASHRLLHDVVQGTGAGLQLPRSSAGSPRSPAGCGGGGAHPRPPLPQSRDLLAGTGGLYGGVERQQVGLLGDGIDDVDHFC